MSVANTVERQMLDLINTERAAAGLNPVRLNLLLNESSEDHSEWMISTDQFSHTGAGGSSSHDRMVAANYPFEGSWTSGENIAWQSERGAEGIEDDVVQLHEGLMDSPGHRANILNPNFTEIGIGIERGDFNGFDGVVVTQNFARTDGDTSQSLEPEQGTPATPVPEPTPDPVPPIAEVPLDPTQPIDEPTPDPVPPVAEVPSKPTPPVAEPTPEPMPPVAEVPSKPTPETPVVKVPVAEAPSEPTPAPADFSPKPSWCDIFNNGDQDGDRFEFANGSSDKLFSDLASKLEDMIDQFIPDAEQHFQNAWQPVQDKVAETIEQNDFVAYDDTNTPPTFDWWSFELA